jgi:hypothetical protein
MLDVMLIVPILPLEQWQAHPVPFVSVQLCLLLIEKMLWRFGFESRCLLISQQQTGLGVLEDEGHSRV